MAEHLWQQQHITWTNVGLTLLWTGLAVALPSWWRVAAAAAYLLLTVVTGVRVQRDARSAQAFLAAALTEPDQRGRRPPLTEPVEPGSFGSGVR
jgi:hypothetical protein